MTPPRRAFPSVAVLLVMSGAAELPPWSSRTKTGIEWLAAELDGTERALKGTLSGPDVSDLARVATTAFIRSAGMGEAGGASPGSARASAASCVGTAGALLGSIPVALIYSFFVKYYVAGLTAGCREGVEPRATPGR